MQMVELFYCKSLNLLCLAELIKPCTQNLIKDSYEYLVLKFGSLLWVAADAILPYKSLICKKKKEGFSMKMLSPFIY